MDKNDLPPLPVLPPLTEVLLVPFAVPDAEWVGDLAELPEEAAHEIRELLARRQLTPRQVDLVLIDLRQVFSTAVEMAKVECRMRRAIDQEYAGSKKPSAKLGVHLRTELGKLRAEFEGDATPDHADICARILNEPVLGCLVTALIEEITRLKVMDPLRNSPSLAIVHLPQILDLLFEGIDQGVSTGRVEPALNFLVDSVVLAILRAAGERPGRTWDPHANEEKGAGLGTCRILAAALNDAMPEDCRRSQPADMVKPYRKAIKRQRDAS